MEDGDGEVRDVGGLLEEEEEEIVVDSDEGSEGSDQTAYDYCPSDHSSEKTASYTGSDDDSYESSSSTSSSSSQIFDDDLFPTPLDCVSDIYPRWQRIVTLQQRYVRQYADHHRLLGVANQKLEWVDENRGVWAPGVYVERLELWRGFRRADLKSLRIAMVNVARMTREKKKLHVQAAVQYGLEEQREVWTQEYQEALMVGNRMVQREQCQQQLAEQRETLARIVSSRNGASVFGQRLQ